MDRSGSRNSGAEITEVAAALLSETHHDLYFRFSRNPKPSGPVNASTMRQETLRPVDAVVGLKLAMEPGQLYESLAEELGISLSTAHQAVQRLNSAGLAIGDRQMSRAALMEFLAHGIRYAFFAEPGPDVRGVPTAHSAPPLSEEIVSDEAYVWPSAAGDRRGAAVPPLYEGADMLPETSPKLYRALALVDAIRVGRARERKRATEHLEKLLQSPSAEP